MLLMTRERIASHLLEISSLVDRYQQRDPAFVEQVIKWLGELEKVLLQLRSPVAAFIAGERGKIIAVHDGLRDPHIIGAKLSPRKASMATASLVLARVEENLRSTITEIDTKFDAWREKMSQLLALASMKHPIPLPPTDPRQRWLKKVWRQLGQCDEAMGMYVYLNAVMSQSDRLHLLDELTQNMLDDIKTAELNIPKKGK